METVHIDHAAYQRRVRNLTDAALRYTIHDADEARAANPEGPKAGYYADEIHYCHQELLRRARIPRQAPRPLCGASPQT